MPELAAADSSGRYIGDELELFQHANNWKAYMRRSLAPFIAGAVAEVGAGIGGTTAALAGLPGVTNWLCVEPDPAQAAIISGRIERGELPGHCRALCGTLAGLRRDEPLDAVLYIDVLEHIDDDRGELRDAAAVLRTGGRIVVLAPAYQFLFSPFDAAVGHHRRYTLRSLRNVRPDGMTERAGFYLDSMGLLASLANKLLLKQRQPTVKQVQTWDRRIVPLSVMLDPLVRRRLGRSAVIVWEKP